MLSRVDKGLLPWVVFILGIILLVTGIFMLVGTKDSVESREISIELPVGCSIETLAIILSRKGLIEQDKYQHFIEIFQFKGEIKPGHYTFKEGADIIDIFTSISIDKGGD